MIKNVETYGSEDFLNKLKGKKPLFLCVMGTTETDSIPNLTGAGASIELMKYTPAADAETIVLGMPKCLPTIPQTESEEAAIPTPGIITKGAMDVSKTPFLAVHAGAGITPEMPFIELGGERGGNIRNGKGVKNPKSIYENGKTLGKTLSNLTDYLVIGESTPAGTTTALGVLTGLGYDANYKVSGCMFENPHELKLEIVNEGLKAANLKKDKNNNPFKVLEALGDPMIPAAAGIVMGSEIPVILAGGSQMTAVCALIKAIDPDFDFSKICVSTTKYVIEDETSDMIYLLKQIGDIPLSAADPLFSESNNPNLRQYLKGGGKEGVGAGGAITMASLQGYDVKKIMKVIESMCEAIYG